LGVISSCRRGRALCHRKSAHGCYRPAGDCRFVLSDTLTLSEAFSGFSDPNVILIAALFIIGDGLVRTGVATKMGSWLVKVAGNSETKMLVYLMLTVAGLGRL
jgi:di/tricarboxylate transporter